MNSGSEGCAARVKTGDRKGIEWDLKSSILNSEVGSTGEVFAKRFF